MTTPAAGGQPTESTEDTGAFADRVTDALDAASLALLLSLGHQSGLFDAMVALPAPATSVQIADAAGLSERYVREWLGGMTVAGVVDYHPRRRPIACPSTARRC